MTKKERKFYQADRELKKQLGTLVEFYIDQVGRQLDQNFRTIITEVAMTFAHVDKLSLQQLMVSHSYASLKRTIERICDQMARDVENYWFQKRRNIELLSRIGMTYMDKKTGPPWKKSKLKLIKAVATDDRFDPRKGHIQLSFSKMARAIQHQIEAGALKGESGTRIIMRIRNMFNRRKKMNIRESGDPTKYGFYDPELGPVDELDMQGPIEVQYGFFTEDDVTKLYDDMIEANGWEYRQYNPSMSDALLANNRDLRSLEHMLYADSVNLVASGQVESAPYLKGVSALVWQVQRPGVCDCCDARNGLTMDQIRKQIKDEYKDIPPALHPNCRCELIPQMNPDEEGPSLEQQGVEWDPETGDLTIPEDVRDKYKMDLSLPEFMKYLQQGGNQ